MDIRDILKSFDSLSEAKTTTDKGVTTHKGDYGREFDTDDEGNAVVKKVKSTEPKPKGRRPDPDRPKLGKDDPKNKKIGDLFGRTTGAVPKGKKGTTILGKAQSHSDNKKDDGTGDEETTSKKSLKEYFDQMDEALYEAALAVQPLPATPQQKQQQQMAGKPSFMIKDPANPSAPAITTQDPAVVQAAKNGTMSMQKPGAAPAAGAGSQVKPMEEGGENWIKGAIKHPGAFTKKASSHGMTPKEFANKVLAHKKDYPAKTEKQAQLAKTLGKMHESYGMMEAGSGALDWKSMITPNASVGELRDMFEKYDLPRSIADFLEYAKDARNLGQAMQYFDKKSLEDEDYGNRVDREYGGNVSSGYYQLQDLMSELMDEAEQPQHFAQSSPLTFEGKKGVNPFAKKDDKKDDKKKPDVNPKNGIPDYAEDGKGPNDTKKKGAAPKKGVNPFAKKDEKKKDKISEGMMDKIKGMLVPKLMKLLGPDADNIANAVKQATGGDLTPSKENAMKVVQALGLDKAAAQGQSQQMAEGIAGNWQGKLIQSLYTLGLLGSVAVTNWAMGPGRGTQLGVASGLITVIGVVLLMFANTFFGDAPGQAGAMGKFGNKGTSAQHGLDDNGMPIRNMNVDESTKKKKVKEGMEHSLQAARLEGKSHALRKMPYNCTHDNMEEARCYHDGFKEGLDECYGQMPILGRTAVDEMGQGPEVATMASYGADDMGMDEGNAFTAGLAKTPHGGKFKVGGSTFTDRTRYDSNLDEFAFESLDKQLNAILENKEVSEGMTVSISKGQQGAPDSVSVSAQDGEADQLLSIIKSAGMGLFGGDEQNGYGAPQGSAGAHGGISVVDDHDGMMALMKKLSGGGEMQGGGDYEDEEGHEGHGEEEHMHGHEETCESCSGTMEENHQCDSQEMVDEVESEDQMLYNVAEDNPPDSGADNTNADVAGNAAANSALATADAGEDEEEGQVYSNSTNEAEDETGEEAGKKKEEKTVAESFANLYKKLAFLSEESTEKKDEKAEKAGKKVANDIEYDEGHKGKDDNNAEKAGKKVTKDIEYDDKKDEKYKKDKKVDESYANSADDTFEADIDFMTKVISGGLNKQKSTGQTTIPVINGQKSRMGVDGLGSPMKESTDLLRDYRKLSGL